MISLFAKFGSSILCLIFIATLKPFLWYMERYISDQNRTVYQAEIEGLGEKSDIGGSSIFAVILGVLIWFLVAKSINQYMPEYSINIGAFFAICTLYPYFFIRYATISKNKFLTNSKININIFRGALNDNGKKIPYDHKQNTDSWHFDGIHWIHKPSSLKFPQKFEYDVQLRNLLTYGEIVNNCSAGYATHSGETVVTVYVYEQNSTNLNYEFQRNLSTVKQIHPNLIIRTVQEKIWGTDPIVKQEDQSQLKFDKTKSNFVEYAYEDNNSNIFSYLIMTTENNFFLKVRYTKSQDINNKSTPDIKFIRSILTEFSIINKCNIFGLKEF